jgi:hypothetical protein
MAKRVAVAGSKSWVLRRLADRLIKRGHARWLENGELMILMDTSAPVPAPIPPKPFYDPTLHHAIAPPGGQAWIDLHGCCVQRWGRGDGQLPRG